MFREKIYANDYRAANCKYQMCEYLVSKGWDQGTEAVMIATSMDWSEIKDWLAKIGIIIPIFQSKDGLRRAGKKGNKHDANYRSFQGEDTRYYRWDR